MNIKRLVGDDDAVSPVIGVILMVAVTVILAAVIGTFVLGIGSQVTGETPKVSFGFVFDSGPDDSFGANDENDKVTITHRGGDDLKNEAIRVNIAGATVDKGGTNDGCIDSSSSWPSEIGAGDDTTIDESLSGCGPDLMQSGDSVKVIWQEDGDEDGSTAIIGEEPVP